ncbi:hypothetical protein GNP82_19725 [Aliivibrio fischeri]|uniref:hypothetical protein n=1 Tax=Aliivibrio fischeri TaxID=668 RepID=UPI0012D891D3|nr:hypothetical protein [Aliivibrio fischeri]MUK39765.1 hypothetical protein [Aliivibrio fischeri]MUL02805.1 hypothetical protein [Aliivibrio fischeri]MUL05535.1 hypothetical protein [Aliivibrio fischeri]
MEFLKGAKDFARNPLGIIALFISLIYGFASLLLNSSADKLTENERWPLIAFIVIFPVLVLITFYRLVTNHHGKLYAPGDFKDDKSFLRTLSPEEQELKLDSEVSESLGEVKDSCDEKSIVPPTRKQRAGQSAEDARTKRKKEYEEFRQDLRLVESEVLRSLSSEYKSKLVENIALGDTDVSFDAHIAVSNSKPIFAEVKALRNPSLSTAMLDRVLYSAVVADRYLDSNFKLILTVVYYFEEMDLERIKNHWQRKVEQCPADVELRFIPRKNLPNKAFKSDS